MGKAFQKPFRPKSESGRISQTFSDGVVEICDVFDAAGPGLKPVPCLRPVFRLCYAERKLGINRYYAARQNQVEIERVLRVPRAGEISSQQVAITEDGRKHRIDLVQLAVDVLPPACDITLVAYEQDFSGDTLAEHEGSDWE